jgi:hypothetical protein
MRPNYLFTSFFKRKDKKNTQVLYDQVLWGKNFFAWYQSAASS